MSDVITFVISYQSHKMNEENGTLNAHPPHSSISSNVSDEMQMFGDTNTLQHSFYNNKRTIVVDITKLATHTQM